MTIRYAVGATEHTVEALTCGYSIAEHAERVAYLATLDKFADFSLAGGGVIEIRPASIVSIEHRASGDGDDEQP
ncbi:hypothetical protein HZZ00_11010 [Streptomyces sp. NEAU-sy36]|uniref:hypothetical protein n=1 Tax=unclassified Streptomyces TaxID=2593676 RepID=UPI0015D5A72E|nr:MULTISPECIES: hypothetical protein [unclassified Streptomyces]QLJ01500.1 hypothetical protein HZZ00_11010 [Streptomyces sp. NEAU-sy36]